MSITTVFNPELFTVYSIGDSTPVVESQHETRLGAKRAYMRLERGYADTGIYPREYGWFAPGEYPWGWARNRSTV